MNENKYGSSLLSETHVINGLPLASVAELSYKLGVFCYDPVATPRPLKHDKEGTFDFDREKTVKILWSLSAYIVSLLAK